MANKWLLFTYIIITAPLFPVDPHDSSRQKFLDAARGGDLVLIQEFLNNLDEQANNIFSIKLQGNLHDVYWEEVHATFDLKVCYQFGNVLLRYAAHYGQYEAVKLLIGAGMLAENKVTFYRSGVPYVKTSLDYAANGLHNRQVSKNAGEKTISYLKNAQANYALYKETGQWPMDLHEQSVIIQQWFYDACFELDKNNFAWINPATLRSIFRNYYYATIGNQLELFRRHGKQFVANMESEVRQQYRLAKIMQDAKLRDINFNFR